MKLFTPMLAVRALLSVTAAAMAFGQGPISDHLVVTLPNTTWVGTQSLPAGKYTIRQLPTASNPRLLEFSSESGTKLEASITTIASINNNNVRETSVVLEQRGGQYFLKNVWIEGKTYGYEIPVNDRQQVAGRTEKVTLTANFAPARTEIASSAPASSTISEGTGAPVAPPTPTPAPTPEPSPTVQQQPAPAVVTPEPEPQARTVTPTPEPAPQAPVAETQPTENTELAAQTPPMPQTASGWPDLLLIGIVLCAGAMLLTPLPVRKDRE